MTANGAVLLRNLPADDGFLCPHGRFAALPNARLIKPVINKNFRAAFEEIRSRLNKISAIYGSDSIAVAVSPRLTTEDAYCAKRYANEVLGTPHVFALGSKTTLLSSTRRFEDLRNARQIIVIGDIESHAIAKLHIKKASEEGVQLVELQDAEELGSLLLNIAHGKTECESQAEPEMKAGYDEKIECEKLVEPGIKTEHSEKAKSAELVELRIKTEYNKKIKTEGIPELDLMKLHNSAATILVFDRMNLTDSQASLIAKNAAECNAGIIQLLPECNSQGIAELGIDTDTDKYIEMLKDKRIRALIIFGGVPSGNEVYFPMLDFLAAQALSPDDTLAKRADVALPMASFTESNGHYTDTTGVTREVRAVHPPKCGYANWQIIQELAGGAFMYGNEKDIFL
jgi:formate dehydrogenase major subunit